MRTLSLLTTLLFAAACGDFSNLALEDRAFAAALPRAQELRLETPAKDETQQALETAAVRQGLTICTQASGVGDLFCNGHRMTVFLNTFTAVTLTILDHVRRLEPSERGDDMRRWGPFPDERDPARSTRITVRRHEQSGDFIYTWSAEVRLRSDGDWLEVMTGSYVPGADGRARQGHGDLVWVRTAADPERNPPEADRIEIRYDLRGDTRRTESDVSFDEADAEVTHVLLTSERKPDGGAGWHYEFDADLNDDAEREHIEVQARWREDGAGRADARITLHSGPYAGDYSAEECWSPMLQRTWFDSEIPQACGTGGCPQGDAASCVFESLFSE